MRKYLLLVVVISFLGVSCSISKAARGDRDLINGSWTLDNIGYENNAGDFKSIIFNDAKAICFEGSTWFFRNNNSTGSYTVNPSTLCDGGERFIRWSVVDGSPNRLQFKFIDEKKKDISGGVGYRLNIASLSQQSMILKANVTENGNPVTVVYEFTR